MNLKDYVANVPNFPKEGIQFKDITPLMADGQAYEIASGKLVTSCTFSPKRIIMISLFLQ